MQRPVWLFSMDSHLFWAAPSTTGGLKAYYKHYGQRWSSTDIALCHFHDSETIEAWQQQWLRDELPRAQAAIAAGLQPVAGFSFYTWNAAEFLALIRFLKHSCPQLLVVAGGPHVQQAEDYLFDDPIDIIFLGEGERGFQEFLDVDNRDQWEAIDGLAFMKDGALHKTAARARTLDLDTLPSALDVVPLTNDLGKPLYDSYSFETSRGCPFKCAFCEWGTGAIGSKMYQHSMARIRRDWEQLIAAGIKDIWLADSNFGALREDLEKAQLICELKARTGLPTTFATSWSKTHSPRVQEIVLLLNQHGLLPHYQLALQTLTPLALELSNRKNMGSNKYEPIAKQMAAQGVPIAAELIWGLPGDNLADFEKNLDKLLATFPNINIFAYTLLPGTEFYEKRHEYRIDTVPVAGYGKAKGEYVVGCHTYDRAEGIEGYFLISAHIVLNHGYLLPFTTRYLALEGSVPVSPLLRAILRALIDASREHLPELNLDDGINLYENRAALYLDILRRPEQSYAIMRDTLLAWLQQHGANASLIDRSLRLLQMDAAFSPRYGSKHRQTLSLPLDVRKLRARLDAMDLPADDDWAVRAQELCIETPGGVGDFLKDPHGGSWMRAMLIDEATVDIVAVA